MPFILALYQWERKRVWTNTRTHTHTRTQNHMLMINAKHNEGSIAKRIKTNTMKMKNKKISRREIFSFRNLCLRLCLVIGYNPYQLIIHTAAEGDGKARITWPFGLLLCGLAQ